MASASPSTDLRAKLALDVLHTRLASLLEAPPIPAVNRELHRLHAKQVRLEQIAMGGRHHA